MAIRFIKNQTNSGSKNMAIDEAVFELTKNQITIQDTFRLFSWEPSAITLGYSQKAKNEVQVDECEEEKIDIIRRISGGGCVIHYNEITYSIVLRRSTYEKYSDDKEFDVEKIHKFVCEIIVGTLKSLGLNAEYKPINDILIDNKKVSGNAQYKSNDVFLEHGTIILDIDKEVIKKAYGKEKSELVIDRITSVNDEIKKKHKQEISKDEIQDIIIKQLKKKFKEEKFKFSNLTSEEKKLAYELEKDKYSNSKWNLQR